MSTMRGWRKRKYPEGLLDRLHCTRYTTTSGIGSVYAITYTHVSYLHYCCVFLLVCLRVFVQYSNCLWDWRPIFCDVLQVRGTGMKYHVYCCVPRIVSFFGVFCPYHIHPGTIYVHESVHLQQLTRWTLPWPLAIHRLQQQYVWQWMRSPCFILRSSIKVFVSCASKVKTKDTVAVAKTSNSW